MNILFIGSSADWHVDLWVKYFTKDHAVYLFSDKEDYLSDQPFEDVTIIESTGYLGGFLNAVQSNSHFLYQVNKLISARYFARQIDREIQKHNIDIVHAHSLYYGFVASYIKSDIPVVFTPMGSDVIIHAQNSRIYRYMACHAFERADVITGDSVLLQNQGYKVGARRSSNYVIQNGVDSAIFFPKKNSLREKYSVADDEVLLFSPRGITEIYNIDVIIESLGKLKNRGYKFKCMFSFAFGDEYSERLKTQISRLGLEDEVIWLGFLTYEDMAEHYNVADVVISVPSSDSSPKSVYEAMFCKKPIVVTDLEWSYELLSECDCFIRAGVRDAESLSQAVCRLIDDSTYAGEIAINALQYAHRYFDYAKNMQHMENIMLQSIGGVEHVS